MLPSLVKYILPVFFLLASCGKLTDQSDELIAENIDLDQIRERGFINALVDNNSYSYFIYRGRSMGFEYELLRLFADHLQVDLRIKIESGIEQAIDRLNQGDGDILAFPLAITSERTSRVKFTKPLFETHQVLVQRKPDNWRKLTADDINRQLIRKPAELINRQIHVRKSSSFDQRLRNLSAEIGGSITLQTDSIDRSSEDLIKAVALGEIELTVADQFIAQVNTGYYPNLDVETVLSLPQQIAWSVRNTSPQLLLAFNEWLIQIKKEPTFMVIYNRYFKNPRTSLIRVQSDYSSLAGNKISPYDNLIKQGAEKLGWDWRLLAAVVYQESKFDPEGESWAGARGLMQLMPETAKRFGVSNPNDPNQSIRAGVNYLKHLDRYWMKEVNDGQERVKFILASYNAGLSHIIDSRKLTIKYGGNPNSWSEVESYLLKKSYPAFYKDPLVMAGYCKCEEPVNYVKEILERYEEYKLHIQAE
ncbi:transporter substrate-binding domain-containing protein [Oscillatoria amoena NRMC-F 0135]|nr:transporter substrate-binding domain-containing protein [Oscillatoria amoena NRMC-F 0135]